MALRWDTALFSLLAPSRKTDQELRYMCRTVCPLHKSVPFPGILATKWSEIALYVSAGLCWRRIFDRELEPWSVEVIFRPIWTDDSCQCVTLKIALTLPS